MPGLTNYVRKRVLTVLTGTDFAGISALYVNLFTGSPTDDGTAAGVTDETEWSCPRVQVLQVFDVTNPWFFEEEDTVTANGGRRLRLINELTWSAATTTTYITGGDETVISAGIFTAATSGTLLAWGPLDLSMTVPAGQEVIFQAGGILLNVRKDI
jgi:hypothetical protein